MEKNPRLATFYGESDLELLEMLPALVGDFYHHTLTNYDIKIRYVGGEYEMTVEQGD